MAKATPNLPASSRMQMPNTGAGVGKNLSINQNSKGATSKVMSSTKGKGMKGNKSCY